MKVKLAAQTLSTRVADALIFLEMKYPTEFNRASATSKFCRTINDVFDFLNSRQKYGKNASNDCVTFQNFSQMKEKIEIFINCTSNLKIMEECKKEISILNSKKRTGFLGLIISIKSVLHLAIFLFEKQSMSYLLTYKLSQDHLETFFSCIRRMGGNNNNPTCRQFRSSYKKLITHVNSIVPSDSNCTLQDATKLMKIEETIQSEHDENLSFLINFEHNYTGCNKWCWNEYNSEVVMYIAGAIVRS